MIELIAMIAVTAVALTFFSDAMSGTVKLARAATRRRGKVRVAAGH